MKLKFAILKQINIEKGWDFTNLVYEQAEIAKRLERIILDNLPATGKSRIFKKDKVRTTWSKDEIARAWNVAFTELIADLHKETIKLI